MHSYTTGIFKVRVETRITRKLVDVISEADCFISLRTKLKKGTEKRVIGPEHMNSRSSNDGNHRKKGGEDKNCRSKNSPDAM